MSVVRSQTFDGTTIEIHTDGFGRSRYWVKVGDSALFQRTRMRVRTFSSIESAWKHATLELASRAAAKP